MNVTVHLYTIFKNKYENHLVGFASKCIIFFLSWNSWLSNFLIKERNLDGIASRSKIYFQETREYWGGKYIKNDK